MRDIFWSVAKNRPFVCEFVCMERARVAGQKYTNRQLTTAEVCFTGIEGICLFLDSYINMADVS